jgi:hypothetical protein
MFVNKVRHTFGIGIAFAFIFIHPCQVLLPNCDQVCQLRTIFGPLPNKTNDLELHVKVIEISFRKETLEESLTPFPPLPDMCHRCP